MDSHVLRLASGWLSPPHRAFTNAVSHVDDDEHKARARAQVTGVLGWLWDSIASPVLGRLGLLSDPAVAADDLPRVWWCAGGPLSLLPLHAAGRDGTAVVDRVTSSYTPTVRTLRHAQNRAAALDPAAGMLVVAMSRTPGARDLPQAAEEMTWLKNTFGAEKLLNDEATRDRVLAALPRYRVVHFACHCVANIAVPSASKLLCHDHEERPLSVAQLSQLDLADAELAYLSACSTSQTSIELADEAVHVTAAFQLAGYAQVIGTLWKVGDRTSARVSRKVYEVLRQGEAGERSAAYALHHAIRAVRHDADHEAAWAPYIHVGA